MKVIDKKIVENQVSLRETNINIQKILDWFSLFEVLYNCVKLCIKMTPFLIFSLFF